MRVALLSKADGFWFLPVPPERTPGMRCGSPWVELMLQDVRLIKKKFPTVAPVYTFVPGFWLPDKSVRR